MKKSVFLTITMLLLSTVACVAPEGDTDEELDEESGESSSAILGGSKAAPSCVEKTVDNYSWTRGKKTVTIKNNCKANLKVGLDLNLEADPECVVLQGNGGTSTWTFGRNVKVSKIKACK